MEKEEKLKLKKKKKLHEKLGAQKFQKLVFGVEKIKFKTLKTICPNFISLYEKHCDHKQKRLLKKAKSEEEKKQIIENIKFSKMAMRKEFYKEKNRNYHIDNDNPQEFIKYLEWNKYIHQKGLIKNAITLPIFISMISLGMVAPGIILLISELVSTAINFECINIQDYNICRYKLSKEALEKQAQKRLKENMEKYSESSELIAKKVMEQEKRPSIDEILDGATKEELQQMKERLLKELRERKLSKEMENKEDTHLRGNK